MNREMYKIQMESIQPQLKLVYQIMIGVIVRQLKNTTGLAKHIFHTIWFDWMFIWCAAIQQYQLFVN